MDFFVEDNLSNSSVPNVPNDTCFFSFFPCSVTITGNLILILFYALILGFSAKLISDGAELLLDLGLPSSIIGGVLLPLLGAIPDCAMIIFSGISGNIEDANNELSVGMGTLAGSTIMLLTLPWLGSLILGRVDIVDGVGQDETRSKFSIGSFINQGVTVLPDVTYSAIIMLITTLPYFIVQGADWYYGPTIGSPDETQPNYIKYSSLCSSILAFIFLIAYLVFQVVYSVASKRKEDTRKEERRTEEVKRQVIKTLYLASFKDSTKSKSVSETSGESRPLVPAETKKFANAWRMHRASKGEDGVPKEGGVPEEGGSGNVSAEVPEQEGSASKVVTAVKSVFYLLIGVVFVTVFSNPMVGALTSLTNESNNNLTSLTKHGQHIPIPVFYVSFIVTPLCSNASEIVSSLIFASKQRKVTSSMTFSQLYGAATMNNTLCLMVFTALVFFRGLNWQFSAEVTVILVMEFLIGTIVIVAGFGFKHTYVLFLGFIFGALYFFSIFLIFALENFAHWK